MMFVVMSQIQKYVAKQLYLMDQLGKHIILTSNLVLIMILVVGGEVEILVEMDIVIQQVQLEQ